MKKHLPKALYFLVSCAFSVCLLEFLVRKGLPQYDPSGAPDFKYNAEGVPLGVKNSTSRMWKNTHDYDVTVRINRYGFRDKKDVKDSTYRDLFVVGDSFSMGWGVEEEKRFSNLLEEQLRMPVYNIAIPGNFEDYDRLVRYAQKNGAKIGHLVIGVCMENDLYDYEKPEVEGAFLPNRAKYSRLQKLKIYLTEHSVFYVVLTHVVHGNALLKALAVKLGLIIPNLEGIDQHTYSEKVLVSSANRLARLALPFKATAMVIPSRLLWSLDNRETEDRVHVRFVALLKERGVDVLDLRPYLEASGNPLQYHFKGDGHWNDQGHAKVAEILAAYLMKGSLSDGGAQTLRRGQEAQPSSLIYGAKKSIPQTGKLR